MGIGPALGTKNLLCGYFSRDGKSFVRDAFYPFLAELEPAISLDNIGLIFILQGC